MSISRPKGFSGGTISQHTNFSKKHFSENKGKEVSSF